MRRLLKKLSTAWLVLALIAAPLQAAGVPLAVNGHDGCPMTHAAQHDGAGMNHAMHHGMNHGGEMHMPSGCPQCDDKGCDSDTCKDKGCCALNLPLSILSGGLPAGLQPAPGHYPDDLKRFHSLPPSPHYRPPV